MNTLSEQAQVAKLIRQYCKNLGIKCTATSDSYAGGNSVHAAIYDQPPAIVEQVTTYAKQFQAGHFDGMIDLYEYSNRRKDIPQAKFVFIANEHSHELKQTAWDYLRNKYANGIDKPADYNAAKRMQWCADSYDYHDQIENTVYRLLTAGSNAVGLEKRDSKEFWASRAQKKPVKPEPVAVDAVTVREGTKPGFTEVVFPAKPEQSVIESLKQAGYRWSRFNGVWYGKTENLPIMVQS